jgi:TetR/AcrR family transcriptional regulator
MPLVVERDAPPDRAVRKRLLDSAARLFAEKGYASTSVREIVAAAGVTKPALYYYFGNKEGVYLEIMRNTLRGLLDFLESFRKDQRPVRQRILNLMDRLFEMFIKDIHIAKVIHSLYYGPPQGAPFFDYDIFHVKVRETTRELVLEGIKKGELRPGDSEDMTWALLGAMNVSMEVQLCYPEIAPGRKGLARILNLIFEGIAADNLAYKEQAQ